jgi:uncharacterized protein YegJ (DUF2314 family)
MLGILDGDRSGLAAIYVRGSAPPGPEVVGHLPRSGYALLDGDVPGARWSFRLHHPTLGRAEVWADAAAAPLADHLAAATTLTPGELAQAGEPSAPILLRVPARWGDVPRDRKTLLRIASAVAGHDGLMVIDLAARRPWSRAALAEEVIHDADLDIEALYAVHGVGGSRQWLHTHGLDELGTTDLDIVDAHPDFVAAAADPIRAIATLLLDRLGETAGTDEVRFGDPGGTARLVPLTTFMTTAPAGLRTLHRELGPGHAGRRVVLCEPSRGPRRLGLGRSPSARPLELARRPPPDRFVVYFPSSATTRMAERARGTLPVLRARMVEFEELRPTALVKLGFPTRDGGQEHLWFEAHGFTDRTVVATLQNEPIDVDLRLGARAERPLDLLTDWALVTPAGWITPRSSLATRALREASGTADAVSAGDEQRAGDERAANEPTHA